MRYGLTQLDQALWLAIISSELVLTFRLYHGKHSGRYPFFAAYTAFGFLKSCILWHIEHHYPPASYFHAYYIGLTMLTLFLSLAVVELLADVIGPYNTIPASAVRRLLMHLSVVIVAGMAAALFINPTSFSGYYSQLLALERFMRFLVVGGIGVALIMSAELGLPWSKRATGICVGLMFCMTVQSVSTMFALHGPAAYLTRPIGSLAYLIALMVWIMAFWNREEAIEETSEPFIEALQEAARILRQNRETITIS